MKKSVVLILVFAVMIFSAACGGGDKEIILPASLVEDTTQEYLDGEVEEGIYKDAVLNDDGSVTYVMSESQYESLIDDMILVYDDSIDEMEDLEDSGIMEIKRDDDFSCFTIVMVDGKMPAEEALLETNLTYMGRMYAAFAGTEKSEIKVAYVDDSTGEVIDEKSFNIE